MLPQNGRDDNGVTCQSVGDFVYAQNLYVTKTSCSDAYVGWVTLEAPPLTGGHFLNIISESYTKVGCSVSTAGDACICCNFGQQ